MSRHGRFSAIERVTAAICLAGEHPTPEDDDVSSKSYSPADGLHLDPGKG